MESCYFSKKKETTAKEVSDEELLKVMADFLEMGHVENIIAMYKHDCRYYSWSGKLLDDRRFNVRLGMSILFEELKQTDPANIQRGIPSLVKLLSHDNETIKGEAISILAIIGNPEALYHIQKMKDDPSPQIKALVMDILEENGML